MVGPPIREGDRIIDEDELDSSSDDEGGDGGGLFGAIKSGFEKLDKAGKKAGEAFEGADQRAADVGEALSGGQETDTESGGMGDVLFGSGDTGESGSGAGAGDALFLAGGNDGADETVAAREFRVTYLENVDMWGLGRPDSADTQHRTQQTAINAARRGARQGDRIVVERRDGTVRDRFNKR